MQINSSTNCQKTQFGMAFRKPVTPQAKKVLAEYAGLDKKIGIKGFKQFLKEQQALTRFDVKFNPESKSVDVIDNINNKVVSSYVYMGNQTGFSVFGEVQFPGEKLLARIFNPKKFLPKNIYLAGEEAKIFEAKSIEHEKMINNINEIFN